MATPDADKKQLSQAAGIPTHTEVLVQKACKTILGLDDAVLEKRGCVPADIKALAEQLSGGAVPQPTADFSDVTEEAGGVDVPNELTDSGEGEPVDDKNPGSLTYEDIDAMTKNELKELAKDCGLSTSGTKNDLFNMVVEFLDLVD